MENAVDSQFDQDVAQLWSMLFAIVLDGEKRLAENLAAHGLTVPQFYVLKTLSEHGGRMGIGQIARAHSLTNATMTGLVKRLEAIEPPLVVREENTVDRRAVYVVLTPAGWERFVAVQASLIDQLRAVISLIPAEERRKLLDDLGRYVGMIVGTSFQSG
jgi:DNA-binding MarR family transcriptional regulator